MQQVAHETMTQEEASRLKVLLQLFDAGKHYVSDESLTYAMNSLKDYFNSGWCGDFLYWKYKRRLNDEWAARIRRRRM